MIISPRSEAGLFASPVSLCGSLRHQARELRCATRAPQRTFFPPFLSHHRWQGSRQRPFRDPLVFLRPWVAAAVLGSGDFFVTPDIIATKASSCLCQHSIFHRYCSLPDCPNWFLFGKTGVCVQNANLRRFHSVCLHFGFSVFFLHCVFVLCLSSCRR